MRRFWICGLSLLLAASQGAEAAKPAKSASNGKQSRASEPDGRASGNAKPVAYENAENKLKFTAPASWETVNGGCAGSIFNFMVPPDFSALPKGKPGEPQRVYGSIFTVAASPLTRPDATLDTAVKDVHAIVKADHPAAEFKPTEKVKIADVDAAVVTASMDARDAKEPKQVQRHVVFLRDGKMYRMILYSHVNSLAKEKVVLRNIEKSFAWTAEPDPVASAKPAPAAGSDPSDGF